MLLLLPIDRVKTRRKENVKFLNVIELEKYT
jgi:hypothetical protein